jgi:hypothetical protein
MPSNARSTLEQNLSDVEELIKAHEALTGGGKGKPSQGQGAALTRAGIVLLAAAMEAFVEDLFREAVDLLYPHMKPDRKKQLFDQTVERLNNADFTKTCLLYFNLGLSWALDEVRWQKFSNQTFQKSLQKLITTRGQIAHGKRPKVQLKKLRDWRKMVLKYAEVLEVVVAKHLEASTGSVPSW